MPMPLDRIAIEGLLVRCVIGVLPEERREAQDVVIGIVLHADLSEACRSDRLEDTLDYSALKKRVVEAVQGSSFFLIERLARMVADICLESVLVKRVDVRVEKPGALRFARTVAVEISRGEAT